MTSQEPEQEAFVALLTELQVPDALQGAILDTRVTTTSDFAYAYNNTEDLGDFIAKQPQSLWDTLQISDPEHCTPVARLRRALDKCKAVTKAWDSASSAASGTSAQAAATNVWAEHAPPRLDEAAVQRMAEVFLNRYSGEHLDPDSMPSIRLLSIVHQWCKQGTAKGSVKWVPWQLRMSQRTYQEIMEARTARTLRTEAQLISTALFDDTPHQSIDKGYLNPAWLSKTQRVFSNAIAMCGGAHLRVLRAFDKKIYDLATQSMPADSGLRTVNTTELLQADRKLWHEIAALHAEGWTLDEALHELTKIRSDIHALLQPRPKPASAVLSKSSKGKKGDGKNKSWQIRTEHLRDDKEIAMLSSAMQNLALTHAGKTLCLRYNRQACTNKQCKYLHASAIRLPNGNACGQRHAAHQHRFRNAPRDSANTGNASNAPAAVPNT